MTHRQLEVELLWEQPWNRQLFTAKRKVFVDFQSSFKSRTKIQALVPGTAGDLKRVILITTCHLIQGYSSKVMRQGSIITESYLALFLRGNSERHTTIQYHWNLRTDSSKGVNWEIWVRVAGRAQWPQMSLGRRPASMVLKRSNVPSLDHPIQ
jgi:hypothetical protein